MRYRTHLVVEKVEEQEHADDKHDELNNRGQIDGHRARVGVLFALTSPGGQLFAAADAVGRLGVRRQHGRRTVCHSVGGGEALA